MRESSEEIEFRDYADESQLEHVMKLVTTDLSEPYSSTFTQREGNFCAVPVGSKNGTSLTHDACCICVPVNVSCFSFHISILSSSIPRIMYHGDSQRWDRAHWLCRGKN